MYYGEFNSKNDICKSFNIASFEGVVLHAQYDQYDYEGDAFVVYANQGKLYLVQGGHCSCMGLEDQWSPEEMSITALLVMIRKGNGRLAGNKRLAEALEVLEDLLGHAPDEIEVWVKLLLA